MTTLNGQAYPTSSHPALDAIPQVVYLSSKVLQEIEAQLARPPPERGGFLFGYVWPDLVVLKFVLDQAGRTSACSYYPSTLAPDIIQAVERCSGLNFLGVIHSHPAALDRPSKSDQRSAISLLKLNPHMPFAVVPIVTQQPKHHAKRARKARPLRDERNLGADHERAFVNSDAKVSFFAVRRRDRKLVRFSSVVDCQQLQEERWKFATAVDALCRDLANGLGECDVRVSWLDSCSSVVAQFAVTPRTADQRCLMAIFQMPDWPHFPPTLFLALPTGEQRQSVDLAEWDYSYGFDNWQRPETLKALRDAWDSLTAQEPVTVVDHSHRWRSWLQKILSFYPFSFFIQGYE